MAPPYTMLCYIGPGGALSAIGSALALLGALIFAILGFVWYPLKRLLRSRRERPGTSDAAADAAARPEQGPHA